MIELPVTTRCTGHCCRAFRLNVPLSEMLERADAVEAASPDASWPREARFVAAMVVPLEPDADGAWYTCRHHDADTGDCRVYEERPQMCRDHPHYGDPGRSCSTPDCSYTGAAP